MRVAASHGAKVRGERGQLFGFPDILALCPLHERTRREDDVHVEGSAQDPVQGDRFETTANIYHLEVPLGRTNFRVISTGPSSLKHSLYVNRSCQGPCANHLHIQCSLSRT